MVSLPPLERRRRERRSLEGLDLSDRVLVGRGQYIFAGCLAALLIVIGIGATPFADYPLYPIPGYMTAFGAAMIVINLTLAGLLFSKGSVERRRDAVRLGTAYLFIATIFIPLTASFPDGLVPGSLIGRNATAVWLWSFWHAGFGLAILRYAFSGKSRNWLDASVPVTVGAVIAIVGLLSLSATVWFDALPRLIYAGERLFSGWTALLPLSTLAVLLVGTVAVARLGCRTTEHLWLTVGMIAACFDVWLTYHGTVRFSLGWYLAKCLSLVTSLAVLLSLFLEITRLYAQVAATNQVLRDLVDRDGLTGLFNRRRLDSALENEWRRAERYAKPLTVLMIDVDHFKLFNDRYGHLVGDDCLRAIAIALRQSIRRPADLVARYGGEEFVVLLPETASDGGLEVAQRIEATISARAIPHLASGHLIVTVSIGAATLVPSADTPANTVLAAADLALYRAKTAGRNRIIEYAAEAAQPFGLAQAAGG